MSDRMIKAGFRQSGLIGLLTAIFAGAAAGVVWPYTYEDNFSSDAAKVDSCIRSLVWIDRVTPPPEPYLYYLDSGWDREMAFMGYQNQLAELGYCFPITSQRIQRQVKGRLDVDVAFPNNASMAQNPPGQLLFSTSSDGVAWSFPQSLGAGHHQISISSISGTAYIRFSGTRATIDNLSVLLETVPATISVPGNFSTIQAAIDAAANGDVIEVANGTYSGSGYQDIQFRGKAITLRSANGPQSTVIDGGFAHRGFHFRGGEGADSIVSGFTIRSGRAAGATGGGIYCEFSSPTIANCIIQNCSADVGGGIGGWGAAPVITDCTVTTCSAARGGGIGFQQQSNVTITSSRIESNSATSNGGGIYCVNSVALIGGCRIFGNSANGVNGGGVYCGGTAADVTLKNCVVASNSAGAGAGIYAELGVLTVTNCTIAQNQWSSGGGIHSTGTDIRVANSIVWGNGSNPVFISNAVLPVPVTYSDIQGGYDGGGNFSEDPQFVNAAAGDYHLRSSHGRYDAGGTYWVEDGSNSPCIDAGDRSLAFADEPAPNGSRVNMGAYGATREASHSPEHFVYHVDTVSGRDGWWVTGLSRDVAFKTITHAIERAHSGDTILVWPGVYEEELVFDSKAITLQSAADAAVLKAPRAYAVSFFSAESSKSILANFVIRECPWGAIFCSGASPTLRNLTIVNNHDGIHAYEGARPYIVNCIFWNNADGDVFGSKTCYYSFVQGNADRLAGNITGDPLFADPFNLDPDQRDFHLKSAYGRYVPESDSWTIDYETSPCIDTGNPEDYYEAELEPNGDVINMGAYGGTPYASKSRNY